MTTKNMLKSRKAISPILATLLLILIAVAAIVVTYAWIMTYMTSAGTQAGVILYKANVRFYDQNGTKKIDIDVGNSGTSDTQIIQVYIGTSSATLKEAPTSPTLPVSLAAGKIVRLTVNYNWTAGATYYFKIIPSAGQQPLGPFPEQAPTS
jgi:flagellin-like protein